MELRALLQAKPVSRDQFFQLLQKCAKQKDLQLAKQAQCLMLSNDLHLVAALGDVLIRLFGCSDCLLDASLVFCSVPQPSLYTWHAVISAHAALGHNHQALELWRQMQEDHGIQPDKVSFLCVLKVCGCLHAIQQGSLVYRQLVVTGHEGNAPIQSALILMYAKCGSLVDARRVFDVYPSQDAVIWGTMLAAYAQHGDGLTAIALYTKMHEQGIQPDKITYLCILKAVGSVEDIIAGSAVHHEITMKEVELDVVLGSTLVDMYAKCGRMDDAQLFFDCLPRKNAITWNAIIAGYVQHGSGYLALELYARMQEQSIHKPERVTFLCTVKACGLIGAVMEGRLLHHQILRVRLEEDHALDNTLIDMYSKCGCLDEACIIFNKVSNREVVSWNSLMGGYTQQGQALQALKLFENMQVVGVPHDMVTFACVLKACASIEALDVGQLLHDHILQSHNELDVVVGSALIDMYCKCKYLRDGLRVFEELRYPNVVTWNAIISGMIQPDHEHKAFELFQQMLHKGLEPNDATFSSILKACNSLGSIEEVKLAHHGIIRYGLEVDAMLVCALVDTYAKCGSAKDSYWVFDRLPNRNVAAWAALIGGYVQNKSGLNALEMFEKMQLQRVKPDKVTLLSALKAATMSSAIEEGMLIHDQILRELHSSDVALGNTLVDMYAKCGRLIEACKVFDELPMRDVVSWGAMITGYTQQGDGFAALELYEKMEVEGKEPEKSTLTSILNACGGVGALEQGKTLHDKIVRQLYDDDSIVGNALVDMYAKCGRMREASKVMLKLTCKDSVSWNAMIAGYAMQGKLDLALRCMKDMKQHGLEPDSYTYTSIIAACSHAGDVQACLKMFEGLKMQQAADSNLEQFNCVIDALGRSGFLDDAKELLYSMPSFPDKTGLVSLLASSKIHGSTTVGGECLNGIIEPDKIDKSGNANMPCGFADFSIIAPDNRGHEYRGATDELELRRPYLEIFSPDKPVKKAGGLAPLDIDKRLARRHECKGKCFLTLGLTSTHEGLSIRFVTVPCRNAITIEKSATSNIFLLGIQLRICFSFY
ncbi:hypothetical protein L7F22_060573 [Adiantum nelumboides]|nr:hypothetical protein [Adiantum nelumboides]